MGATPPLAHQAGRAGIYPVIRWGSAKRLE
jgi:hypothetical protein